MSPSFHSSTWNISAQWIWGINGYRCFQLSESRETQETFISPSDIKWRCAYLRAHFANGCLKIIRDKAQMPHKHGSQLWQHDAGVWSSSVGGPWWSHSWRLRILAASCDGSLKTNAVAIFCFCLSSQSKNPLLAFFLYWKQVLTQVFCKSEEA